MPRPFERLDAWKLAQELSMTVQRLAEGFPASERYRLTQQLKRAVSSVPANIAEGSGAPTRKDFARFLAMASRSLNEVAHWLNEARQLSYLEPAQWRRLNSKIHRVGRVTWHLRQWLLR